MLAAVNGYIDGNRLIVDENIEDWQGRNVVVTILESSWQKSSVVEEKKGDENRKAAVKEFAGLWKNYDTELSVEDTVRNMRRGHHYKVVDELEMKIFRP